LLKTDIKMMATITQSKMFLAKSFNLIPQMAGFSRSV